MTWEIHERVSDNLQELMQSSKNLLDATTAIFANKQSRMIAEEILNRYPEYAKEMSDVSASLDVSVNDIMLTNISYDIMMAMGCSTIALPSNNGPLLVRNLDWIPPGLLAKASTLIPLENGVSAGVMGMTGVVTGISYNGFAIVLNAAAAGFDLDGFPMLLFIRKVLDTAKSFNDALQLVQTEKLMSGGILTLVGTTNDQRAIVERSPASQLTRTPLNGEPLFATNHFRNKQKPEVCSRYTALEELTKPNVEPLSVLTNSKVVQTITAQHVVMEPATKTIKLYVPKHQLTKEADKQVYSASDFF